VGATVTGISHVLLWWVLAPGFAVVTGSDLSGALLAELLVWLGEAFGAWLLLRVRPAVLLTVSAFANLTSLLAGLLGAAVATSQGALAVDDRRRCSTSSANTTGSWPKMNEQRSS
jgi:hypothetical protein